MSWEKDIMPKVSVIVPCLNMKEYIDNCMNSIMNQTLEEIEILVVDAGSSDGTLEILDKFIQADERIHLIHSMKKSYGYQVNLGIRRASGEYIAIVDADDRIGVDMYKTLYNNAVYSEADYVKGAARSFYTVSDDFTYYMSLMQFSKTEYQNSIIEVIPTKRTDLLTRDNFLWYGIYRQEFIKSILLHESPGAAFQDFGGLLQTQIKAQKAVYLKNAFYEYRQDNIAASNYNPRGFQFVWEEYIWAEQFIVNASDEWKTAFYRKLFLHTMSIYHTMAAAEVIWENSRKYICLIREKLKSKLNAGVLTKDIFSLDEWANLQILLDGERGLYDKLLKKRMCRKQQFINIMAASGNREIVIFGYGNIGTFVYAQIVRHKLGRVVAFCDNQLEKHGLVYDKVSVLPPAEAVKTYPHAYFVITSERFFDDMKKQLIFMNISEEQVGIYTAGLDMRMFGASLINDVMA